MRRIPKSMQLLGHTVTVRICNKREWEALCEMCPQMEEDDFGAWFQTENLIVIRRTNAA